MSVREMFEDAEVRGHGVIVVSTEDHAVELSECGDRIVVDLGNVGE